MLSAVSLFFFYLLSYVYLFFEIRYKMFLLRDFLNLEISWQTVKIFNGRLWIFEQVLFKNNTLSFYDLQKKNTCHLLV